jgi:hypothetical protein
MKRIAIGMALLVLGLGIGGGAAFGTARVMDGRQHATEEVSVFVATGPILAPLVFKDGRLAGYVTFDAQIEVPASRRDIIKQRLPVLLDAINMRTYRTPLASGPDGLLPSIAGFRHVLREAAVATYGKETIRRVAVTQAMPA